MVTQVVGMNTFDSFMQGRNRKWQQDVEECRRRYRLEPEELKRWDRQEDSEESKDRKQAGSALLVQLLRGLAQTRYPVGQAHCILRTA